MASHNVYTFFSVNNCLDADFDAPDAATDHDLCCAIVAGKAGMHPEAWDSRSALTAVMPQGFRGYEWVPEAYRRPIARSAAFIAEQRRENTEWEARWRPRPVEPKPRRKPRPKPRHVWPGWHPHSDAPAQGTLQLTCDVCERRLPDVQVDYYGDRPVKVAVIRALGHTRGWTCIAGVDRCPQCSEVAAPKAKGNGAGNDQGNEHHA